MQTAARLTTSDKAAKIQALPHRVRVRARHTKRTTKEMADAPIPSVVAMLVCDQVIAEQGSGKKSLIGIFENVNAIVFPTPLRVAVYAKLRDAHGHYKFRIRLVKLKDEKVVIDLDLEADIPDPTNPTELGINILGIMIPEAGKYEFQLYGNDIYLHRATMNAIQVQGGLPWVQQQQVR